jgi:hypothetical protein
LGIDLAGISPPVSGRTTARPGVRPGSARFGERQRLRSFAPHFENVQCHGDQHVLTKDCHQLDQCKLAKLGDGTVIERIVDSFGLV